MSLLADHPRARWAAPAAAVAAVGVTALVSTYAATADATLPPRSAAQLVVDVQRAQLRHLSGTVVQSSDLGLPDLSGLGGPGGHGSASLESAVTGTHTWRVWYGGPDQQRLALVGQLGESDVIRNGTDLWVWSSEDQSAVHHTIAAHDDRARHAKPSPNPAPSLTDLPRTPEEAATRALAALEPSTRVSAPGSAVVAGRDAYELVLQPRDGRSLVGSVRIAVDAEQHIPLRVQVFSTTLATPAFEVGFTSIDFSRPDARQFDFNPPPGTTVTEAAPKEHGADPRTRGPAAARPAVVGTGWSAVAVGAVPPQAMEDSGGLQGLLRSLPRVSGSWGSGRLLSGTLFSAVLTDDGRFAVGAVAPDRLYAALAAR